MNLKNRYLQFYLQNVPDEGMNCSKEKLYYLATNLGQVHNLLGFMISDVIKAMGTVMSVQNQKMQIEEQKEKQKTSLSIKPSNKINQQIGKKQPKMQRVKYILQVEKFQDENDRKKQQILTNINMPKYIPQKMQIQNNRIICNKNIKNFSNNNSNDLNNFQANSAIINQSENQRKLNFGDLNKFKFTNPNQKDKVNVQKKRNIFSQLDFEGQQKSTQSIQSSRNNTIQKESILQNQSQQPQQVEDTRFSRINNKLVYTSSFQELNKFKGEKEKDQFKQMKQMSQKWQQTQECKQFKKLPFFDLFDSSSQTQHNPSNRNNQNNISNQLNRSDQQNQLHQQNGKHQYNKYSRTYQYNQQHRQSQSNHQHNRTQAVQNNNFYSERQNKYQSFKDREYSQTQLIQPNHSFQLKIKQRSLYHPQIKSNQLSHFPNNQSNPFPFQKNNRLDLEQTYYLKDQNQKTNAAVENDLILISSQEEQKEQIDQIQHQSEKKYRLNPKIIFNKQNNKSNANENKESVQQRNKPHVSKFFTQNMNNQESNQSKNSKQTLQQYIPRRQEKCRKKSQRQQLKGSQCPDCQAFYQAINDGSDSFQNICECTSRHKSSTTFMKKHKVDDYSQAFCLD